MRKHDTQSLGDVLKQVLRQNRMDYKLNEMHLIQAWPTVLGAHIAQYTQNLRINNRVLYVHITSPALRSELFMARQLLVKKLNESVGSEVIKDIKFA